MSSEAYEQGKEEMKEESPSETVVKTDEKVLMSFDIIYFFLSIKLIARSLTHPLDSHLFFHPNS
jgi:Paraquat-inducible protein A